MSENYILRIVVEGKQTESAKTNSKEAIMKLARNSDISMKENGYNRVGYSKVRIDKKHITTITLSYSKV